MRASLVSREVIADSIELVVRGNALDGVVALVGCDKTIPGGGDGARAAERPRARPLRRIDRAGALERPRVTIQDVFEAVGAHAAGRLDDAELRSLEDGGVSGRGRVRRTVHREHDGDRVRVPRHRRARQRHACRRRSGASATSARTAGEQVMALVRAGIRPARSPDAHGDRATRWRRSPRPAARPTPCCTCSRSRAKRASTLALDEFDALSARVPLIADLKPARPLRRDRSARGRRRPSARASGSSTEARRRRRADRDRADRSARKRARASRRRDRR